MSRTRRNKKQADRVGRDVARIRRQQVRRTTLSRENPDTFGLKRESLIAQSRVRHVFTPHQPISQISLLFGRAEEVGRLVQTLNTPGQHVLLYGERGVGKSSLSNIVAEVLLSAVQPKLFVKRCDQSDVFESILLGPLKEVGADLILSTVSSIESSSSRVGVTGGPLQVGGEKKSDTTNTYITKRAISPSTAAEALYGLDGLLVVDEFDAIQHDEDRRKMAELIKQLSDSGSPFKIMVVGIAETGDQLTAAHPSVQRCLRETKLNRMDDAELRAIITSGSEVVGVSFTSEVVNTIVRLSAGYPHFTHLLALKCAEDAIGEGRKTIAKSHLMNSMKRAVADAEGTLQRIYDDSTRSASDMHKQIIAAAASLDGDEFSSLELRAAVKTRTGEDISQGSLNNYFQRLMSSDNSKILRRVSKGVYRFEDPRMRSYVRIVNQMT